MTKAHSLYRQAMGTEFHLLATELQGFHSIRGRVRLSGRCTINGPHTALGRLMSRIFALPKSTEEASFWFELEADAVEETWRRHFPGRLMVSRMHVVGDTLVERLGPAELQFELKASGGRLSMLLQGVKIWGIPCPGFLLPSVLAEETASPGKLHFNVAARLPFVGLLAEYRGFLNLGAEVSAR